MRIQSLVLGTLTVVLALSTSVALALDFALHLPGYRDAERFNTAEAAGIGLLTNLHIVSGNPDGTFAPSRTLNRAEFLKVAYLAKHHTSPGTFPGCFPDVPSGQWFTSYVCAAKAMGVVAGNPDGKFHPERTVQYAEALKILGELFDVVGEVPSSPGPLGWYIPYREGAYTTKVGLPGMEVRMEYLLTRGEMARLTAAYIAHDEGQLDLYRMAERGEGISSSSSSRSSSRSSSSSSRSSSSSSASSVSTDPLSDTSIRSQFMLLGETSPVLGAAKVFLFEEPLELTSISVNLTTEVSSVESLSIYDDNKVYIGRAIIDTTAGTNRKYTVTLPRNTIIVPKATEKSFYVRANLKPRNQGGQSDEIVEINNVIFVGNGTWSTDGYTKATTEAYRPFKTARAVITSVTNAKDANGGLTSGTQMEVAAFRFAGRKTDSTAQLQVTDLRFQIEQTNGVTLSNVKLRSDGLTDKIDCSVASSIVTCPSLSAEYGSINDQPRTIYIYADVTVPGGVNNASLRLTLNETGTISTGGAVTWTDGSTVFTWLPFDGPVASGTYWKL